MDLPTSHAVRWSAADLRPQRALASRRSYHRCVLSPDEQLVAFGVQPLIYGTASDSRLGAQVLPTGAPSRLSRAEVSVADVASLDSREQPDRPHSAAPAPPRALTPGWGTSWGPCWSPDGRRLAFFSDRNGMPQVWLWDRETGAMHLACEEAATLHFAYEGMRWLPDGRRLVAKLRPPDWDLVALSARFEQASRPDGLVTATGERDVLWVSPPPAAGDASEESLRWFDLARGDIAVIDVETGLARRIGTGVIPRLLAVSPDGLSVAAVYECMAPEERHDLNVGLVDVRLFPTDGAGEPQGISLAERVPQAYAADLSWSPRSDALAYIELAPSPTEPGRLCIVSVDGRERRSFGGDGANFGHRHGLQPPLWSPDGQTLYAYATGPRRAGTVLAVDRHSGAMRDLGEQLGGIVSELVTRDGSGTACDFGAPGTVAVLAVDPQTRRIGLFQLGDGKPERLVPDTFQGLRGLSYSGDCGERWVVGPASSGAHPHFDLYAFDTHSRTGRRVTALNDHLSRLPRLESFMIPMEGPDGTPRQAALWLPLAFEQGRRYPAVVNIYLGRRAGPSRFDPERLRLADAGYLQVEPDMPHIEGLDTADAVTAYALRALDAAVARGLADPERAAVMGHSAGGYNACCVITRTNRFRAAVASAPFADLVSFALTLNGNAVSGAGHVEGEYVRLGGTLWQQRERYVANSPVHHADRVHTPLLLLCGTADPLISQAEEMYAALLRQGKPATLVRYHGEGHTAYNGWLDVNLDDYWSRIIGWLDTHLA